MCPSRRELATSLHMATLGFAESGERPPLLVEELGDSVPAQDGASRRGDSVPVQDGAPRRGPDGRFTMSDGGGGGSSTRTLFSITGGSGDGRAVAQATIKTIMHNRTPAVAFAVGGSGGSNTGEITSNAYRGRWCSRRPPPLSAALYLWSWEHRPGPSVVPEVVLAAQAIDHCRGGSFNLHGGSRPSSQRMAPPSWRTCPSAWTSCIKPSPRRPLARPPTRWLLAAP